MHFFLGDVDDGEEDEYCRGVDDDGMDAMSNSFAPRGETETRRDVGAIARRLRVESNDIVAK